MNKLLIVEKLIKPKNPIFIAAWPGMGHVALKAADYLRNKLSAQYFAKLESDKFFYPSDVSVEGGLIAPQKAPEGKFYFWRNPAGERDLIIFLSDIQPPAEKIRPYAQIILDFILRFEVKTIFTFAAMLATVDCNQMPKVWLAATYKKLMQDFKGFDVRPMESGQISGLNGFFLELAKEKKLQGACLLCEIPFYTAQMENPRASLMVLKYLTQFFNFRIDFSELSLAAKAMEEEMEKLLNHLQDSSEGFGEDYPISTDDVEKMRNLLANQSQIPNSAKRQIEDLFSMAKNDIASAFELKQKLDEWNAYKDYEDRFLELFKEADERDN